MNRNEIESDPHALLEGMLIAGLRDRRHHGHHLRARRVSAGRASPGARHRAGAGVRHCWATTSSAAASTSTSRLVEGAGRLRLRRGDGADRLARRPCRAAPAAAAFPGAEGPVGHIPPTSTTSRPGTTSRPSSPRARPGSRETGSAKSPGTKVFSLVGKVKNTGLVEMPLGTPLKTFIYDVGEGGANGHAHQGGADRRAFGRLHSRRRCSTRRWITRRWRSSAPSWARAAWW